MSKKPEPPKKPVPPPPPASSTGMSMEDANTIAVSSSSGSRTFPPASVPVDEDSATIQASSSGGSMRVQEPAPKKSGADSAPLPDHMGNYKILGKLGEGGMGIVYDAEQQFPRRRVALKVMRGGRSLDEATVRMFRREVETLARLRHPNIGAIYESGRSDDGQYFFAMELVLGDNLDVFLSKRPPVHSSDEMRFRLGLFRKIADAVHYAHQRGVIHRDLKPSNIIISREADSDASITTLAGVRLPDVKILDFGLARITESEVAATQVTEVGVIKGTLPYMAPEQARGDAEGIDVRTDVYSLGVILYEMLSNTKPYDVSRNSLLEAVRVICEEPPRSLRTSMTLSGVRRLDADIETVVNKALEKDPSHRYSSAAAMAEDVERYLSSQPILARPPSTAYQIRKFAARNRALVIGVAATFIVLVAGVVVSSLQALRATKAEELANSRMARAVSAESLATKRSLEADSARTLAEMRRMDAETQQSIAIMERTGAVAARGVADKERAEAEVSRESARLEASKARAINRFLQDMLATADPWAGGGGKVTLDAALTQAQARIGTWAGSDPEVDYAIRGVVANAFTGVGKYAEAESLLRSGIDQLSAQPLPRTDLVAGLRRSLGRVLSQTANYGGAERQFRLALTSQSLGSPVANDTTALILSDVASALARQGRYVEADTVSRSALDIVRTTGAMNGQATPSILRTRAYIEANWKENYASADSLLRASVWLLSAQPGDRGVEKSETLEELANNRVRMGDLSGADSLFTEAVAVRRKNLGENHPLVARALENQGQLLSRTGRPDQGVVVIKQVLAIRTRGLGPQAEQVGRTWLTLAPMQARANQFADAQNSFDTGISILKAKLGERHPDLASAYKDYAELKLKQKKLGDAEKLARLGLGIRLERLGGANPGTVDAQLGLAEIIRAKQLTITYPEAEKLMLDARATAVKARGVNDAGAIKAAQALARLCDELHRPAEAAKWRAQVPAGRGTAAAGAR